MAGEDRHGETRSRVDGWGSVSNGRICVESRRGDMKEGVRQGMAGRVGIALERKDDDGSVNKWQEWIVAYVRSKDGWGVAWQAGT